MGGGGGGGKGHQGRRKDQQEQSDNSHGWILKQSIVWIKHLPWQQEEPFPAERNIRQYSSLKSLYTMRVDPRSGGGWRYWKWGNGIGNVPPIIIIPLYILYIRYTLFYKNCPMKALSKTCSFEVPAKNL